MQRNSRHFLQVKALSMETAYIALGANIPGPAGSPQETLEAAILRLGQLGTVVARSRLYLTAPVGYADQPAFLNAAASVETTLEAEAILERMLAIELSFGRDRSHGIPNGPRSLDLDLLLYGDRILKTQNLEIPHPRMAQRAFVLVPLAEIAPGLIHPQFRRSVKQLLQDLEAQERDFSNGGR
jgi:2-amino-4-hydroxy-6-hydroxymethyldihydropteridine diphosphokinase